MKALCEGLFFRLSAELEKRRNNNKIFSHRKELKERLGSKKVKREM